MKRLQSIKNEVNLMLMCMVPVMLPVTAGHSLSLLMCPVDYYMHMSTEAVGDLLHQSKKLDALLCCCWPVVEIHQCLYPSQQCWVLLS